MNRYVLVASVAVLTWVLSALGDDPAWIARGRGGMVASDSPEASQIGADLLKAGGNAFDAAVATSFALTVARPQSTGLGGGGFMLAYVAKENRFVALDFRETAPMVATREHYAKLHAERGRGPAPSVYGGNAVGVPGLLAGLAEINKRFGTRPLAELIRPAAALAQVGVAVDAHHHEACREALADFEQWPQLKLWHKPLYKTLLGEGNPPAVGSRVKRPDLAQALQLIAREGPQTFYRGAIAAAIVDRIQAADGVLTRDDLRNYRVVEREPLRVALSRYELVTMPPPSSGGVCLVETLNVLECIAEDFHGGISALRSGNLYAPTLILAFKHAFADRARWLGDPDFSALPVATLTSRAYACRLAGKRAHEPGQFGSQALPDDQGTSHFCVADQFGNVVALTETINGTFGSLIVVEPYGIILNNEMDDFLTVPGQPNLYGLQQGAANLVQPGKRPLSSMAPTIVLKDGKPVLVLGAAGGPRIITAVAQVILNVLEFEQPLEQAIAAVRLHHQWQPDELYFDGDPPVELVRALEAAGQKISAERRAAVVQAIQFLPDGTLVGASDPRKGGRPAAVP